MLALVLVFLLVEFASVQALLLRLRSLLLHTPILGLYTHMSFDLLHRIAVLSHILLMMEE